MIRLISVQAPSSGHFGDSMSSKPCCPPYFKAGYLPRCSSK
uniref:Uncharacterized protein n=1 Tax=Anguilla anguilla TaxID=7936 RepID=A0A0E9W1N6_ANGAN